MFPFFVGRSLYTGCFSVPYTPSLTVGLAVYGGLWSGGSVDYDGERERLKILRNMRMTHDDHRPTTTMCGSHFHFTDQSILYLLV